MSDTYKIGSTDLSTVFTVITEVQGAVAVPTPVQRVANVERAQLMIESAQRVPLQRFLSAAQATWFMLAQQHRRSGLIRWAVDVDPLSI